MTYNIDVTDATVGNRILISQGGSCVAVRMDEVDDLIAELELYYGMDDIVDGDSNE